MNDETPRWKYRFKNYSRAFTLLREAIDILHEAQLNQLEKEGIIQRFEYTMELAWKVMKDYLENDGVVFTQTTPGAVIRKAFETGLIGKGETWMDALDARNKISHTYDFERFEQVISQIQQNYLGAMEELYLFLMEKSMDDG